MKQATEVSPGLAFLRTLPRGTTLYTILRSVSRSGMSRVIDVRVMRPLSRKARKYSHPETVEILCVRVPEIGSAYARDVERATQWGGDYKVNGCGMDMGFHLVSALSRIAFPHADRPDYYFNHRWL